MIRTFPAHSTLVQHTEPSGTTSLIPSKHMHHVGETCKVHISMSSLWYQHEGIMVAVFTNGWSPASKPGECVILWRAWIVKQRGEVSMSSLWHQHEGIMVAIFTNDWSPSSKPGEHLSLFEEHELLSREEKCNTDLCKLCVMDWISISHYTLLW